MVLFIIGPQKAEFKIHKYVVCDNSRVLRAAFNSSFIEGQTQTYRLEDVSEKCFMLFFEWIYSKNINASMPEALRDRLFLELWVLADKLLIPRLRTASMEAYKEFVAKRKALNLAPFEWVWENTAMGSPLRRVILHYTRKLGAETFATKAEFFPKEMLIDLAIFNSEILQRRAQDAGKMADLNLKEEKDGA